MGKTLTARGSLGAKTEATEAVAALARRFEIAIEDMPVDDRDARSKSRTLLDIADQIDETIQRLDWAEEAPVAGPKYLTMIKDGVEGRDLGVIGHSQYAITKAGDIMRRRAEDFGTYGGWRWECDATHARAYRSVYEKVVRAIDGLEAWL